MTVTNTVSESERLNALAALRILDTAPESHFDAVCRVACALFRAPIALVSLIDADRQWFKARCGLDVEGTAREVSFCTHAIASDAVFVVEDASRHPLFSDNPLVTGEPGIRFYAGAPLVIRPGVRVGTLCVIDRVPRRLSDDEHAQLADLAEVIVAHLRLQDATMRGVDQRELLDRSVALTEQLRATTALLTTTLDNMDQGLLVIDAERRVPIVNRRAVDLLDLPPEMAASTQRYDDIIAYQLSVGEFAEADAAMRAVVSDDGIGRDRTHIYERTRPNGTVLEIRTVPLPDGGAVRTYTDVTLRKAAETALRDKTVLLDATLENMDQGILMVDRDGIVRVCNERAIRLLDLPPAMMRAQPSLDDVRSLQLARNDFVRSDETLRRWVAEVGLERRMHSYERERPNGTVLEIRTVPLPDGSAVRTYADITERRAAEGRIAHMARHDALTDLPNRALFRDRLAEKLAVGGRRRCAVLFLDLDRFKAVNDTLGHSAGDTLLREVAHRIRSLVRADDTVARLGGDEFGILLGRPGTPAAMVAFAARLIAAVQEPVMIGEERAEVGLSVGIAVGPQDGADCEALLAHADLALYRAKADGRSTFRFFEPSMDEDAADRRQLHFDLRRAIGASEFLLHYQPIATSATGELVGFEALVRWQHPVRGLVSPGVFIPLAEETGLIVELGEWVLREACREAARWTNPLRVAVNLSTKQFERSDLPEVVLAILTETGLSPARLKLEITETVIINDMARALGLLRRLKALGVRIAMDDFGTGYSSLATLQAFPFDTIKIDRSFVGRIGQSPQAEVIVRAVLGLGRNLGMKVVAEGVETGEQMAFLVEESCDELQGYLLGRPYPIECFADVVSASEADWRPVRDRSCRPGLLSRGAEGSRRSS